MSELADRADRFLRFADDEQGAQEATSTLKRMLSTTSTKVTTSSGYADSMDQERYKRPDFRCIGAGSGGTVWEIPGTETAVKTSNGRVDDLWTDYNLTNRAYKAFLAAECVPKLIAYRKKLGIDLPRVPKAEHFYTQTDDDGKAWWKENIKRFVEDEDGGGDLPNKQSCAFTTQRILPFPEVGRHALIRLFANPDEWDDKARSKADQDCLVRLYLGRNKYLPRGTYKAKWRDSLRNFEMARNFAINFGLNIYQHAREQAFGMAILHWIARIDCRDTEWVIGSAASQGLMPHTFSDWKKRTPKSTGPDFTKRGIHLWVLDFDKADLFDLDWSTDKICEALRRGTIQDPYFPHPGRDIKLFGAFEEVYLHVSEILLTGATENMDKKEKRKVMGLPKAFIESWKKFKARTVDMGFGEDDYSSEEDDDAYEDDEDEDEEDSDDDADDDEEGDDSEEDEE